MTFCILDLETENREWFGNNSSPHNPENWIVAAGWCIDNQDIQSEYFPSKELALSSNWLERALQDQQYLVAHNATFEIQWLMKYYPDTLMKFFKRGGKVFCTQYAEYLLSHQQEMYPRLEDCSIKYGGTVKVDEVKLLWEAGYTTSQIDRALLMKYLADPVVGDVANTRRVAFSQIPLLQQQGMWKMCEIRMDSLLFNAVATYFGLYVDLEVAKKNQAEQEQRIEEIKDSIKKMLPTDLPSELEFSFTSPYHMSAFLFGGTIQYKAKVSYEPKKYEQIEAYEFTNQYNDNVEYIPVAKMTGIWENITNLEEHMDATCTRFKAGKNKGQPKVFKIDSDVEKLKWGDKQYTFKGLIDLNKLPNHVKSLYLDKRAEFRGARELVCGTPVYSTSGDSLDVLAEHTEAAKPLKELKALEKDTGTYYLRTDANGKQSGMLQFVEPDGIIHHRLNNCSTVTGRLSGSNPNMQNIPRDGTSKVKEMFSSRFGELGRVVEVDYSALEVVALASISGDKNLLENLLAGTDMHCYRLAGALGESYESVVEKCNNQSHPEYKKYKQLRTGIKPKAFANQYGASAEGIAHATGCTVEEAIQFKETELKLFPESSVFAELHIRPEAERTGLESKLEREQDPETGVWKYYRRGYFRAKGGTCYSFRQFPKREDGKEYYDYKDTQIANYPIQGEASFIVQAACGRIIRKLFELDFVGGLVLPINTVHDAAYLDCATEELAKEYGALVRTIMEGTPKWLTEQIPAYKDWNYHTTPFPAAAELGINMMNKVHIE
ncbi:putative DNA polymerase [Acinetobacter phage Aristophanes]|uniref:Putative DNA polymerase n=1 Tax=Acinetobacter phage Aristophanes TaxID=2759203 RepID=A0A7G9VYM5_BPACA|nr:putative DNA polymerase [Acinetobacter phage Aristophanes]